ncbi:MAG TPA: efflux RND transporter permease subunit [Gammaproteobacteria bacterium]|nr:efflux RND transporter permease subunit [Gammaproteobacteria bacterium]
MKVAFVEWVERHRRSLVFLAVVLAAGGALSAIGLPTSLFPHVQFPRIRVSLDAGDRPAQIMELQVTRPMELAVRSVPGVTAIHSTTSRGSAEIIADFAWGTDMVQKMLEVEGAVNRALPQTPPGTSFDVERMEPTLYPVVGYSLTSKTESPVALRNLAEFQLRPLLAAIPGVLHVGVQGGQIAEYHVDVNPARLHALGLSFQDVAQALAGQNVFTTVGRLTDHYQLYLTVADSRLDNPQDIGNVVLKSGADGIVRLRDVARVIDSVVPRWVSVRADGQPAVLVNVFQQPGGSTLDIAHAVAAKLATFHSQLPKDVVLHQWYDQSYLVAASAGSVRDALIIGVILAALVLLVFLRSWKVAAIACIAVPVVLMITVLLLKLFGQGFNIMTLGGMAAAIGLFIDDVVVVVEHLVRRMREAGRHVPATLFGAAREFTRPLMGSSLSTIVIFAPLAFLGGITGAFFKALSLTMACGLVISFFIAWLVVPVLASWFLREKDASMDRDGLIARPFKKYYRAIMHTTLRRPWWLAVGLVPLIVIGTIGYTQVGSGFLPKMDEGGFILDYLAPPGASLAETNRLLAQVGKIIDGDPAVATWSLRTGTQLGGGITEANTGDFFIKLKPFPRPSIQQVMDRIRVQVENQVPALDIDTGQLMEDIIGDLTAKPQPVVIKLFGDNNQQLLDLAPKIGARISKIRGVVEVRNGIVIAGSSLDVRIDRTRSALKGLTPAAVSAQVEAYMRGMVATQVQKGIQFVGIRVWVPPALRATTEQVSGLLIRAPNGKVFPLNQVAQVTEITGQPEITREDLKRTVEVTARISGRDLGSTIAAVKQALDQPGVIPAGVYYELGGLYQQQQIAFRGLIVVFITALALVFLLLLFLYERFRVALVIILQPLFAIFAVFFGLWITGTELNITAMMGLTMIIGIVTEIAIFYFSEFYELEHSMSFRETIVQAGLNRARPIALTTLAFVLALLPLAFDIGRGSAMLAPLARAIIFGLAVQFALVLGCMPVLYYWINPARRRAGE